MNASAHDRSGTVRLGLLAAVALAAALVTAQLVRYHGVLAADPVVVTYLALLGVGLAVAVVAAVAGTRSTAGPVQRGTRWDGCRWGVLFGGLWIVEMAIANLGYPLGRWLVVPYLMATWSVVALTVLAGLLAARRYGRWWAGTLIGTWSGLVSGLVGLATMQVLALAAMPVLRRDPQNLAEFRGARDLATAIAGDFLAAGINHLVLVGLVVGTLLGTLGGAAGRLTATGATRER